MMVSVWLLVMFLNDEPVIKDEPYPEQLIFRSQKACEDLRENLLDALDADLRCIEAIAPLKIRTSTQGSAS